MCARGPRCTEPTVCGFGKSEKSRVQLVSVCMVGLRFVGPRKVRRGEGRGGKGGGMRLVMSSLDGRKTAWSLSKITGRLTDQTLGAGGDTANTQFI